MSQEIDYKKLYENLKTHIESQEKQHYESLIKMFKWLMGIVAIVFTAGAGILTYNISEIKENIKTELETSRTYIDTLKSDANRYLAKTKNQADLNIGLIEKEARIEALSAIKIKLANELQKPTVQNYIYSELRNNIDENLDILTRESYDESAREFKDLTRNTSDLIIAYQQAIWNNVDKVKYLDSIAYNSNNKELRENAKYLIDKVRKNYVTYFGLREQKRYSEQIRTIYKETVNYTERELVVYLIKKIESELDSEYLTKQFQSLIEITGSELKVLEFEKLKRIKDDL